MKNVLFSLFLSLMIFACPRDEQDNEQTYCYTISYLHISGDDKIARVQLTESDASNLICTTSHASYVIVVPQRGMGFRTVIAGGTYVNSIEKCK